MAGNLSEEWQELHETKRAAYGYAMDDHMQTVIERLFAPVADGIVRDDLGEITPLQAVLAKLSRTGR